VPHNKIFAAGLAIPLLLAQAQKAAAAAPLQYLSGAGDKATPVVWLTWGLLLVSVLVILIISGLLAAAIWHRPGEVWAAGQKGILLPDRGGVQWLWIGVGTSAFVLLISVIWTVKVLADIQAPGASPTVTIEVTGRQFWWQAHYLSDSGKGFYTANELHIPVGKTVRLKLIGGDVIHSFWVPQLAGKMDAIPGQINETWIEASRPGIYEGQCTEYCGVQHSKMLLRVIAQPPADFEAWRAHQATAPSIPAQTAMRGEKPFVAHCGNCHAVRGTEAHGTLGPDLSHLMDRRTIASGILPNDAATLRAWVADPQGLKPGNLMPAVKLSDQERGRINDYLLALQ
jgi:cytochrome c oxidase subunit 2